MLLMAKRKTPKSDDSPRPGRPSTRGGKIPVNFWVDEQIVKALRRLARRNFRDATKEMTLAFIGHLKANGIELPLESEEVQED